MARLSGCAAWLPEARAEQETHLEKEVALLEVSQASVRPEQVSVGRLCSRMLQSVSALLLRAPSVAPGKEEQRVSGRQGMPAWGSTHMREGWVCSLGLEGLQPRAGAEESHAENTRVLLRLPGQTQLRRE